MEKLVLEIDLKTSLKPMLQHVDHRASGYTRNLLA